MFRNLFRFLRRTFIVLTVFASSFVLVTSLLTVVVLPVMTSVSITMVDTTTPVTSELKQDRNGKNYAENTYNDPYPDRLPRLYEKYNFPHRPDVATLFVTVVIAGIFYLVTSYLRFWSPDRTILVALISQVVAAVATIGIGFFLLNGIAIEAYQFTTTDPELLEAARRSAQEYLNTRPLIAFVESVASYIVIDIVVYGLLLFSERIFGLVKALIRHVGKRMLEVNPLMSTVLTIRDESLTITQLKPALVFKPLPVVTYAVEASNRTTLDYLFYVLFNGAKEAAFQQFRDALGGKFKEMFSELAAKASTNQAAHLAKQLQARMNEISQSLFKTTEDSVQAKELLHQAVDQALSVYHSDLSAGVVEAVEAHLQGFRREITTLLNPLANLANHSTSGDFPTDVLPLDTRYFFRSGYNQFYVIEQKPQVRNVFFTDSFLDYDRTNIQNHRRGSEGATGFYLAFPYIYFVVVISEMSPEALYVFYANRAVRSLTDVVYSAKLPNIAEDGSVCIRLADIEEDSVSDLVNRVIGHFWQTAFNTDIIQSYQQLRRQDSRFRNVGEWQENSRADPQFVLTVDWGSSQSFQSFLMPLIQNSSQIDTAFLLQDMQKEFLNYQQTIAKAVDAHLRGVRFERMYPKTVEKTLTTYLTSLMKAALSRLEGEFAHIAKETLDPSLAEALNQVAYTTAEQLLAVHFGECAESVLFRRQTSGEDLVNTLWRR